jgi:hypothetical protein
VGPARLVRLTQLFSVTGAIDNLADSDHMEPLGSGAWPRRGAGCAFALKELLATYDLRVLCAFAALRE